MSELQPFHRPEGVPARPRRRIDARHVGTGTARARLRARADQEFLEPEEFTALLLSRRELERVEDASARLYGLFDRRTGETFWIEAERLAAVAVG